jgi:hypothetical protein
MTVTEAWAGGYEVSRPDRRVLKALPPEALPFNEHGRLAWLRPVAGEEIVHFRARIDVLDALDRLFACETPYNAWCDAVRARWLLEASKNEGVKRQRAMFPDRDEYWAREVRAARSLILKETRRRQKFDRALTAWANDYGLLGVGNEGGDYVPDIFRAVRALRAWAVPTTEQVRYVRGKFVGRPNEKWEKSSNVDPRIYRHEELRINAQAQLCRRSLSGEWEAPTLWAAMCHVVRNADMLGLRFAKCAAEDCFNPFLQYGKREHCSKRCANRAGEQRLRLEKTLRE